VTLNITNYKAKGNLEAKFDGGTISPQHRSCQSTATLGHDQTRKENIEAPVKSINVLAKFLGVR
jgi:hypothetical protein